MIDEKKVKLMTKAAVFEKKERRKAMKIIGYRRQDYIVLHVILSWICVAIVTGLIAGVAVVYVLDNKMQSVYQSSQWKLVIIIGAVLFFMFSFVYCFFAYWHYGDKYEHAEKKFQEYEKVLKQLNKLYECGQGHS